MAGAAARRVGGSTPATTFDGAARGGPALRAAGLVSFRSRRRDADLRFNHEEATRFLNECMGLSLAPAAVARLAERTERWIAGLQMAALALQGETDPNGFLDAFTGSNRYLVEFLFENLLQRQSPEVQSFLGQTAFLDRLCGPLCEAVTGMRGGQAMLERLEEANLFLTPLDRDRRWYRYQPFFASALRAWSLSENGEPLAELHERAEE